MSLWSRFVSWIGRLFKRGRTSERAPVGEYRVEELEDFFREEAGNDILYLEVRCGRMRWAHFRCPCGCEEVISVNLMESHVPHWKVVWHEDGVLSLVPSVNKTSGCRSQFFIQRNAVVWADAAAPSAQP